MAGRITRGCRTTVFAARKLASQRSLCFASTMLPTFLGIGAPKAGTTWLYELLDRHPDVVMSRNRKEVHFFDRHFDRGRGWYERFFTVEPGERPGALGEFTPHYLYNPVVPSRVRTIPSIDRFVLIVRNPVDRAFSHFRFRERQDNQRLSFEEFLASEPTALAWGFYGRNLRRWLDAFDRSWFLILPFEEAVQEPEHTKRLLAQHLRLDADRFPDRAVQPANESFVPRRRGLYAAATRQAKWLRRHDLDRLISLTKRSGTVRLVKQRSAEVPSGGVSLALRERLWDDFEADVTLLEDLTGLDLVSWRPTLT